MPDMKLWACAATVLLTLPGRSLAQERPQDENAPGVGDIVVTAQKRSESANRVGLTVQALSGDDLVRRGITSIADLTKVVPALSVTNSIYNTPVYTLRGVGFYENSLAAYPAVSVYVDEVPLPFPSMVALAALDVSRVEVLKGPQGTLFGQNATGGAINYIAARPTSDLKAGADLSVNNFGEIGASGFVSGPLGGTVRARLAVKTVQGGAWQRSYTRDAKLGDRDFLGARLLLDWDVSERLKVNFNVNGVIDKSDPQAGQYFALFPQIPPIGAALGAVPFAPATPRAADWNPNHKPKGDDRQWQVAARADFEVTSDITLTSITSYVDFKRTQANDPDGVALEASEFDIDGTLSSFNQELRLAGSDNGGLRWILGGNYEHSKSFEYAKQLVADGTVGTNLFRASRVSDFVLRSDIDNYAVFGNVDWEVVARLTLKGGIRYTKSVRDADTCTLDAGNGLAAAFFTGRSTTIRQRLSPGTPPTPLIPTGGCVTLSATTFLPTRFQDRLDEDNVSWRAGADYRASATTLLYMNVSKGYKAGSFLFTNASSDSQFRPVTQESVLAFEGGIKAKLLSGRVQFNAAGFYYKYRDKQIRGKSIDPVFGVLSSLVNVPKSNLKGAEVEITAEPVDGLRMSVGSSYVDTRIDEYVGVGFVGGIRSFEGDRIPFAPVFSINSAVDYEFPVSASSTAFLGGTISHNSSAYSVIDTAPTTKLKAYTVIDLRAGISFADKAYRVSVFANNVGNEYYYSNAPIIYDTQVRYTGRPATYGVSLATRW